MFVEWQRFGKYVSEMGRGRCAFSFSSTCSGSSYHWSMDEKGTGGVTNGIDMLDNKRRI